MSEARTAELLRRAAGDVPVGAPPVEQVRRRGERRRRVRRTASVVAAGLAVASVAVGIDLARDPEEPPRPAGVVRTLNPLPLAWWGDGVLHLDHVAVPAADVTDVTAIGRWTAYGTESGEVVLVDADGRSEVVGHKAAAAPMAGDAGSKLLAWVDPGDDSPQLVAYDVVRGVEVGRLDLPNRGPRWGRLDEGSYPISVDGGRVAYAAQDGDWWWVPGRAPSRITPDDVDVSDARAGYRASRPWRGDELGWPERLSVVRPYVGGAITFPGGRARFSPDGRYLLVRDGGFALYATDDPDRQYLKGELPGLRDPGADVAFAWTDEVVVASGGQLVPGPTEPVDGISGPHYGTWDLSACVIETGMCTTLEDATTDGPPILAQ